MKTIVHVNQHKVRAGEAEKAVNMQPKHLHEAMSAALELTADGDPESAYTRGIAELIAELYLPVGSTGVARDMVIAGLFSSEW